MSQTSKLENDSKTTSDHHIPKASGSLDDYLTASEGPSLFEIAEILLSTDDDTLPKKKLESIDKSTETAPSAGTAWTIPTTGVSHHQYFTPELQLEQSKDASRANLTTSSTVTEWTTPTTGVSHHQYFTPELQLEQSKDASRANLTTSSTVTAWATPTTGVSYHQYFTPELQLEQSKDASRANLTTSSTVTAWTTPTTGVSHHQYFTPELKLDKSKDVSRANLTLQSGDVPDRAISVISSLELSSLSAQTFSPSSAECKYPVPSAGETSPKVPLVITLNIFNEDGQSTDLTVSVPVLADSIPHTQCYRSALPILQTINQVVSEETLRLIKLQLKEKVAELQKNNIAPEQAGSRLSKQQNRATQPSASQQSELQQNRGPQTSAPRQLEQQNRAPQTEFQQLELQNRGSPPSASQQLELQNRAPQQAASRRLELENRVPLRKTPQPFEQQNRTPQQEAEQQFTSSPSIVIRPENSSTNSEQLFHFYVNETKSLATELFSSPSTQSQTVSTSQCQSEDLSLLQHNELLKLLAQQHLSKPLPQQRETSLALSPQQAFSSFLAQQRSFSPPVAQQQTFSPPLAQLQTFSPPVIQQQSIKFSLAQQQTFSPPLAQQQTFSPPVIQQQSIKLSLAQQQTFSPPLAQQQTFSPPLAQQQNFSPPLAQQQNFSPPLIQRQFFSPQIAQQKNVSPPLAQQKDFFAPFVQSQGNASCQTQQQALTSYLTQQRTVSSSLAENKKYSDYLDQQQVLPTLNELIATYYVSAQEPTLSTSSTLEQQKSQSVQQTFTTVDPTSTFVQQAPPAVQQISSTIQPTSSPAQQATITAHQTPLPVQQIVQPTAQLVQQTSSTVQPTSPSVHQISSTVESTFLVERRTSVGEQQISSTVQLTSLPVQQTSSTVQPTSLPVQQTFSTVQPTSQIERRTSVDEQQTSSTVQLTSLPVQQTYSAVQPTYLIERRTSVDEQQTYSTVQLTSLPVQQTSSTVQPTSLPVQQTSSTIQPTSLPVQQTSSTVQQTSLPVQQTSSTIQPTSLPVQQTSSTVQQTSPSVRQIYSTAQPTSLAEQPTSLPVQQASSTIQSSLPVQQASSTIQSTSLPVQQASSTIQPTSLPVQQTSSTIQPTSLPAQQTSSTVQQTSTPLQQTSSTVQPTSLPVQQSSSTVQQKLTPVQPTSSTIQQTPLLVQKTSSTVQQTSSAVQHTPDLIQQTSLTAQQTNLPVQPTSSIVQQTSPIKHERFTSLLNKTSPSVPIKDFCEILKPVYCSEENHLCFKVDIADIQAFLKQGSIKEINTDNPRQYVNDELESTTKLSIESISKENISVKPDERKLLTPISSQHLSPARNLVTDKDTIKVQSKESENLDLSKEDLSRINNSPNEDQVLFTLAQWEALQSRSRLSIEEKTQDQVLNLNKVTPDKVDQDDTRLKKRSETSDLAGNKDESLLDLQEKTIQAQKTKGSAINASDRQPLSNDVSNLSITDINATKFRSVNLTADVVTVTANTVNVSALEAIGPFSNELVGLQRFPAQRCELDKRTTSELFKHFNSLEDLNSRLQSETTYLKEQGQKTPKGFEKGEQQSKKNISEANPQLFSHAGDLQVEEHFPNVLNQNENKSPRGDRRTIQRRLLETDMSALNTIPETSKEHLVSQKNNSTIMEGQDSSKRESVVNEASSNGRNFSVKDMGPDLNEASNSGRKSRDATPETNETLSIRRSITYDAASPEIANMENTRSSVAGMKQFFEKRLPMVSPQAQIPSDKVLKQETETVMVERVYDVNNQEQRTNLNADTLSALSKNNPSLRSSNVGQEKVSLQNKANEKLDVEDAAERQTIVVEPIEPKRASAQQDAAETRPSQKETDACRLTLITECGEEMVCLCYPKKKINDPEPGQSGLNGKNVSGLTDRQPSDSGPNEKQANKVALEEPRPLSQNRPICCQCCCLAASKDLRSQYHDMCNINKKTYCTCCTCCQGVSDAPSDETLTEAYSKKDPSSQSTRKQCFKTKLDANFTSLRIRIKPNGEFHVCPEDCTCKEVTSNDCLDTSYGVSSEISIDASYTQDETSSSEEYRQKKKCKKVMFSSGASPEDNSSDEQVSDGESRV
ncbi:titin homolog isoform X2 [Biomphalaria glabrata]|uniref:Titin homolog isoform X2 n=1 Tax=Biomphalaria glabrata TaxID=6526 RepID=A0A9W3B9Y2_BIOGL|nr:titin homolog isoform X2 [Biomphalaria glabrata]